MATEAKKKAKTKIHVRKDDTVIVLSGKDAGKKGKVLTALPAEGKVVVEGVAMVTKHQKPRGQRNPGGLIRHEAPIYASKVMLMCAKCSQPTRIAHMTLEDGRKVRVCKKCGETFDR